MSSNGLFPGRVGCPSYDDMLSYIRKVHDYHQHERAYETIKDTWEANHLESGCPTCTANKDRAWAELAAEERRETILV